jgi:hypothetical protein
MPNEQISALLTTQRYVVAVAWHERSVTGVGGPCRKQLLPLEVQNLWIEIPGNRQAESRLGTRLSNDCCL